MAAAIPGPPATMRRTPRRSEPAAPNSASLLYLQQCVLKLSCYCGAFRQATAIERSVGDAAPGIALEQRGMQVLVGAQRGGAAIGVAIDQGIGIGGDQAF